MDLFVVRGGIPLRGTVSVSGAKNSALPIMAACLALDGESLLHSVPDLVDVRTLAELLSTLGMTVSRQGTSLALQVEESRSVVADYELVRKMRASFCVLGPLLAKRGEACVSLPGGCNIGARPIDLHLKGLRALGAEIDIKQGYVIARAKQLRGAEVDLLGPNGSTVTGTCNVMVAATLATGTTIIHSAACEPEVVDLGEFLIAAGANIDGLGTHTLQIEGVEALRGVEHIIIPDRIEAATLMMAAAITHGEVTIENTRPDHLGAVIHTLQEIGVRIDSSGSTLTVSATDTLHAIDCCACPYPGIPTDVQAQLMALLSTVPGLSTITDHVFPDRFMHAAELVRLGANIRREGAAAFIEGVPHLSGTSVMASDLRASAALVLATLAARGDSVIRRIYHLDRGYESLERKLSQLGARIERRKDTPENIPPTLTPLSLIQEAEQAWEPSRKEHPIPAPHLGQSARQPHAADQHSLPNFQHDE